jgi:hypothetical protein
MKVGKTDRKYVPTSESGVKITGNRRKRLKAGECMSERSIWGPETRTGARKHVDTVDRNC